MRTIGKDIITQDEITDILVSIGDITGVNLAELSKQIDESNMHFNGNLRQHEIHSKFEKALRYYKSSEYECTYLTVMDGLYLFLEYYSLIPKTADEAMEIASMYTKIAGILSKYKEFNEILEREVELQIKSMAGGLPVNQTFLDPRDILNIRNQVNSRYLKLYCYRKPKCEPRPGKFAIKDTIVATDSILDLIGIPSTDDLWHVHIGLMIERFISLSYFVIAVTYKDGIWVLCDKPEYNNIDQIDSLGARNGGRRFSEDRERNLDFLPYILIDKVIEARNNTSTLARDSGQEMYTFDLKEYLYPNWLYLIDETINQIMNQSNSIIKIAETTQLAIGPAIEDIDDESAFLKCNNEELQKIFDELHPKETLPAVTSQQIVKQLSDAAVLMGEDEFNRNVTYLKHKAIADAANKEQIECCNGDVYSTPKDAWAEMNSLVFGDEKRVENMNRILFSGKIVRFVDIDTSLYDMENSFNYKDKFDPETRIKWHYPFVVTGNKDNYPWSFDMVFRGWTERTGYYNGPRPVCSYECGTEIKNGTQWRVVSFMRYSEMMALLSCERSDLPVYYRNYLSYKSIPYSGNSILSNVKPEFKALEKDPCSVRNPNSVSMYIPYCGNCQRKLYKKYKIAEESLVVYSSKLNKVLDIIDVNDFDIKKY